MPLRLKRNLMKDKAQLQKKSRQKFSVLHLSVNSSPTTVFRLISNSKNRTAVIKTSSYRWKTVQNSLIFYLYQSLKKDFSHMGASSKCRVFAQSIQFCQYTLMGCDCSTSSSLGEILIGMKAFCENKAWKYILSLSSLSSLPEEILKS